MNYDAINPDWLRENYDYDPLRCAWYAKGARIKMRNDVAVDEPARFPFPPFGFTDRMLAELGDD